MDTINRDEARVRTSDETRVLVLGAATAGFDPARHVAIGPWCFAGQESTYPDWEQLTFVETFSPESKASAAAMTYRLTDHMIERLRRTLNAHHGVSYGHGYWRILLMPWVLWVCDSTWRAWHHAVRFVEAHPDERLEFSTTAQVPDWDFIDYLNFLDRGFHSLDFSAWLHGYMLDLVAPPEWPRRVASFSLPIRAVLQSSSSTGHIGSLKWFVKSRVPFTNVAGVGMERLLFAAILALAPRRAARTVAPLDPAFEPHREFPAAYLDRLDELTEAMMPRYLRGDFSHFDAAARRLRPKRGSALVGAPDVVDIAERFRFAHAVDAGARLGVSQHGGGYGTFLMNGDAAHGEYRQHKFLTWGWAEQSNYPGNFQPLPSPLLSKMRNRHRERDNSLVLVGGRMALNAPRLVSAPEPSQWIRYRHDKVSFIERLASAPRTMLRYRPYERARNDLADFSYVTSRCPNIEPVVGDLHAAMFRCRLLVVDHPTTTLHIALAANVPTVAFWDPDAWPMCRQFQPILDQLAGAGIVAFSPVAAAEQVNAVWHDVGAWWQCERVQRARVRFCQLHASTSPVWWWHWARAMASL